MPLISVSRLVAACLAVFVLSNEALAESQSGTSSPSSIEFLLRACKSPELGSHAYCLGKVTGVAAVMELVALRVDDALRQQLGMCVAAPFPNGDAEVQAFVNWANANPSLWGQNAEAGIMIALSTNWPCS